MELFSRIRQRSDSQVAASNLDFQMLQAFWPALPERDFHPEWYRHLLKYFKSETLSLKGRFPLPDSYTKDVADNIIQSKASPRSVVTSILQTQYGSVSKHTATKALEMTIRQWAMLDIHIGTLAPGINILTWPENESIQAVVGQYFQQKRSSIDNLANVDSDSGKIDESLTLASLVKYQKIRILWTSNLADHLSMDLNRRALKVFAHKIWVLNSLTYPDTSIIEHDVLEELMDTFNLLFPGFNKSTEALLEKHGMRDAIYALGSCSRSRQLNWSAYKYWRRELQDLSALLREPPRGMQQFWQADKGQRNLLNLALFWLSGVMVLILTIVSSVCGILSVRLSQEQRDLAADQVYIALLAACTSSEVTEQMLAYCEGHKLWRGAH